MSFCLLFVPKFRSFLLVVLWLASRMLRMVIPRVGALFSAICPKVSLFFASNFKVGFLKSTNGDGLALGPFLCYLSDICPKVSLIFASSFKLGF